MKIMMGKIPAPLQAGDRFSSVLLLVGMNGNRCLWRFSNFRIASPNDAPYLSSQSGWLSGHTGARGLNNQSVTCRDVEDEARFSGHVFLKGSGEGKK
jgi:hypothetical protein